MGNIANGYACGIVPETGIGNVQYIVCIYFEFLFSLKHQLFVISYD